MERGEYRPHVNEAAFHDGLPQAGSDQTGSAATPFNAFVESLTPTGEPPESEERGVQVADPFTPFYQMHSVNERFERVPTYTDIQFEPTAEQNEMIKNVKLA